MNIKEIEKAIRYLEENPPEVIIIKFDKHIAEDKIFHGAMINQLLGIKWGEKGFLVPLKYKEILLKERFKYQGTPYLREIFKIHKDSH